MKLSAARRASAAAASTSSYSRYKIWWNSLALIAQHPWFGVGFGEFNFAWTLTPFPGRPVAFFDHAHNLMLQFAVELGIPLTLLVIGLMGYALWQAKRNAVADGREPGARFSTLSGKPVDSAPGGESAQAGPSQPPLPMQRAAFVMVVMAATHSLLEYPLWYSYFLLPAAFAFGLCLERPDPRDQALAAADRGTVTRPLVLAPMVLILATTLALWDYMRVVIIFAPPANAAALDKRIADGRHSVLFAHHADYAAANGVVDHPGAVMDAFRRAPHFLLDARLMLAWARALDEVGETDKARFVAARLREFHNEQADEFFAPCSPASTFGLPFRPGLSRRARLRRPLGPRRRPRRCPSSAWHRKSRSATATSGDRRRRPASRLTCRRASRARARRRSPCPGRPPCTCRRP